MGSEATPLEASLANLANAADLLGLPDVASQVAEAARRLAGLELEVAVVGEFKRGKSTLLNALIQVEVLPAGVLPLTAVPTVLERGDPVCLVAFGDGHTEEHDLEAVAEFVTEERNPGNRLGVQRVVVRLHAPLLDEGVRLVDTPGVGSVLEHNTRATDAYLPSLDAAILVTSADPPISKGERALLERLEAERPALLERLAGPLLDRAEAAALAAYANAIGPVVDRAGARLAQLHQEAASAFEVCLPAFTPPEVDTTVGSVGVATPRVTHLADELVAAAWRLRGRRGARERAVTRARAAAASDADALVGRLRGATSMTLGEASRRLAGQLRRHQRELAGSLRAAVDRGGALLEAAERDRTNRQATLDQVAALLQQAEAALSPVDQDGSGS